jgi:hypothetical protein
VPFKLSFSGAGFSQDENANIIATADKTNKVFFIYNLLFISFKILIVFLILS